jgi:Domain of unknown function (DUF4440)
MMNARRSLMTASICAAVMIAAGSLTYARRADNDPVVAVIAKIENDTVRADLANDTKFFEKTLADDWSFGSSDGTWYTKAELLKEFADPPNNKTSAEKISELKVRVYGDTAIATYRDRFDDVVKGEHRVRNVISTDTFVRIGGEWKEVASHSCQAK